MLAPAANTGGHRVSVRITDVAKTVANCFTSRNRNGLDFALEVLCEAGSDERMSSDELQ